MKNLKILGIAGAMVASAMVGGALISTVAASPSGSTSSTGGTTLADASPGAYCQTFLDAFAANLGVDVSALTPAAKDAAKATVDQAVANGDLSQAVGDAIKQRIDNAAGDGCAWLGTHWRAAIHNAVQHGIGADMLQAAADTLNMTPAELRSQIVSGESLKKIAQTQGVSYDTLTAAIHDAAKADLDKLVSAGQMTTDRENQILDRIDRALTDGKLFNGNGPLGHRANGNGNGPAASAPSTGSAS